MKNTFKLQFILMTALLIFGALSCKKNGEDNDSDLTMSFQTRSNGTDFKLGDIYKNDSNVDVKFEKFQFYLSDITLVNSDGDERLISEIELFKFNSNGHAALDFQVPRGNYETIKFGLGVKQELNEADPANYSDEGHPLSTTENTYWGWATMYRFVTLEGRSDSESDGDFEGTFAYHTGNQESYRNVTIPHKFEISKKEANFLNFEIDAVQILDKPGNKIDMVSEPYYHGGMENFYLSEKISDNMVSAISIIE